ncbi:MAG: CHAT domain-containing protein, partial [Flavobacteriales bacterium]|nr:CHAT domain-containing protein [Flavobacteriales bacterium]
DIDSTFIYAEKALANRRKYLDSNHPKTIQNLIALGSFYKKIGNYETSIDYTNKALKLALSLNPLNYNSLVSTYFSLGSLNQAMFNYKEARENYDTALSYYKDSLATNMEFKGHVYNAIGVILEKEKDFASALIYYDQAIAIFKQSKNTLSTSIAYDNKANVYSNIGYYTEAKEMHKKVISLFEKEGLNSELPWRYFNLGALYLKCDELDSALVSLKKAEVLNLKFSSNKNQLYTLIQNHLTDTNIELDKYEKAEQLISTLLKTQKDEFGLNDPEVSYSYYLSAKNNFFQEKYTSAIKDLEQAENILRSSKKSNKENKEQQISLNYLLSIKILREKTLWQQYAKENDIVYLETLYNLCLETNKLGNKMIHLYEDEESKLSFFNSINENLYLGIKASKKMHDLTNNIKYVEQALSFFEAEKSFLLKQKYKTDLLKINLIPEDLILREDSLIEEISRLQNKLYLQNNTLPDELCKANSRIFNLNMELSDLGQQIEDNYPRYETLKTKNKELFIKDIRKKTTPNELLIEYFQYKDEVFSIGIEQANYSFKENKIANLNEKIKNYEEAIQNSDIRKYTELAFEFYSSLVKNHLYSDSISCLTIIPSKSISFLSFDTFLTTKATNLKYNHLNYLILEKSVCYKNSIENLNKNQEQAKEAYLGICPDFSNTNKNNLSGAYNEVKTISNLYGGTILPKEETTKQNLLAKLPNYQIIHFATHTNINTIAPQYSSLFLMSDTTKENKLFAYEIQNSKLNADLVILSACSTGMGKLKNGEGLGSIGRCFNYAGVKSVILGLWDLPDLATAKIIEYFFSKIDVLNKAEALKSAKLKYLESADDYTSNPIYWAGLILIGENTSLKINTNDKYTNYLWGLCCLFSVGILLAGRKFI